MRISIKTSMLYKISNRGFMEKTIRLVTVISIALICISCTAYLDPHDFDRENITAPSFQSPKPISVKARLVGTKERELPVAGATVIVNEDEFTKELVEQVSEALKNKNIQVVPHSDRVVEIQVVRVALQPDRTIYCVIDYNRKLGDGAFYGFQSRSKNWNFNTACNDALKEAANAILNEQTTIKYFKGE